jgi:hypothetical protein
MAAKQLKPAALLDTSAILAVLDHNDLWHRPCGKIFREIDLPLLTSEAVLTELFHLAGKRRVEMEDAWAFLRSGAVAIGIMADEDLPAIHALMSRYPDRPMDFADATLVYLAKRESLSTIFTTDHADFATYRITGRQPFAVLPLRRD